MELDVHLERGPEEPWGFQLDGGADFSRPLTVIKVFSDSLAERAGLQKGDLIKRINQTIVGELSQEAALEIIIEARDTLDLRVFRGLYDPVLDDQEPIYETYEPADFDPRSEPTEVQFKIQQFIESPSVNPDSLRPTPLDPSFLLESIRESRSLTASPFLLPSKEYRPFSTEPLPEIPPLEDPIILNPSYSDAFGKSGEDEAETLKETKFKLPVSEQFDPEGKKNKIVIQDDVIERKVIKDVIVTKETLTKDVNIVEEIKKDVKVSTEIVKKEFSEAKELNTEERKNVKDERMSKEEVKFMEKMKKDIDIDRIEETALNIVDESIERAVSVTEEIKQEIYDDLSSSEECKIEIKEVTLDEIKSKESFETSVEGKKETHVPEEVEKNVELIDETTEQSTKKTYSKSEKEAYIEKQTDSKTATEKPEQRISSHQHSNKQEVEEMATENIEKPLAEKKMSYVKQDIEFKAANVHENSVVDREVIEITKEVPRKKSVIGENRHESSFMYQESPIDKTTQSLQNSGLKSTVNGNASRTQTEQRLYTIGLQSIPNIRGTVHSYHYDLLLKTFFIHLTDVMVALSRFILTQPVFSTIQDRDGETTMRERIVRDTVCRDREDKEGKKEIAISEQMTEKLQSEKTQEQTSKKEFLYKEQDMKIIDKQAQNTEDIVFVKADINDAESIKEIRKKQAEITRNHKSDNKVEHTMQKQEEIIKEPDVNSETKQIKNMEYNEDIKQNISIGVSEKRKLSGAEMAQLCEPKSGELTQKMDAVISELQTKTTVEESELRECRRRSRSRSQIEEDVMRESDPLEWLAKVDSRRASQEIEINAKKQFSNTLESMVSKKFETKNESKKIRTIKPKPGRQTYIAIVEAHVYTNKDVIFEDHVAELSETTSVQSADELSTAFEASEAIISEKVAFASSGANEENAKSLIEPHELSTVRAKSEATLQMLEETAQEIKESYQDTPQKQQAIVVQDNKKALVQEMHQIIEPVVEIHEKSLGIIERVQSVAINEESFVNAAAESTEMTDVEHHEIFDEKEMKTEKVSVCAGENYNALQVSQIETETDELSDLKISEHTELADYLQMVNEVDSALQISEVNIARDELAELKLSEEKTETVQSVEIIEHAALQITEIELAKDELAGFEITKQEPIDGIKSLEVDEERQTAVQVMEVNVRSSKDESAELIITKQQAMDVSESIEVDEERTTSRQITEVETLKDEFSELKLARQKVSQCLEVFEERDTAVQVNEEKAAKNEFTELKINKKQEFEASATIEDNKTALQITEVNIESMENGDSALKVSGQTDFPKSLKIIEEKDTALQISEINAAKDELAKLKIIKKQEYEASTTIEDKDTALQITNVSVESSKNEVSDLEISKQQVEIAESLQVPEEKDSNIQISKVNIQTSRDESAELKIDKQQATEMVQSVDLESELNISQHLEVNKHQSIMSNHSYEFDQTLQESSFMARSAEVNSKLRLRTDLARQTSVQSDENNNIGTPSPSTAPPTPLIDEYIFKLEIPLPKSRGTTPIPPDPSPEKETHEDDLRIVKKNLIPHIETTIERIIYDPPLPTPTEDKPKPVYNKPGLRGGAYRPQFRKEEIREIERKSSLLASAIDETIKSIEEYKEEVGIETKKEVKKDVSKTKYSSTKSIEEHSVLRNIVENRDAPEIEHAKLEEEKKQDNQEEIQTIIDNQVEDKNKNLDESVVQNVVIGETAEKTDRHHVEDGYAIKADVNNKAEIKKDTPEQKMELSGTKERPEVQESLGGIYETPNKISEAIEAETIEIKSKVSAVQAALNVEQLTLEQSKIETEEAEVPVEPKQQSEKTTEIKIKPKAVSIEPETFSSTNENVTKWDKTEQSIDGSKKIDYLQFVKPVKFDPEAVKSQRNSPIPNIVELTETQEREPKVYITETGEPLGTIQGIVDGLEEAVVDEEVAKVLGKPGISEEKIAELISGEAEILREAHVMGLSRVLTSHMNRVEDDSSVDFHKIKPMVDSLKDSEVLKALNEELVKSEEEKKKEQKKWTTFLQKPKRAMPRPKFGYYGYIQPKEEEVEEPYKVKIVKQPKPKVAPDYKPEDFDTGPLPWEERAITEAALPPVEPEEPILVPEEAPEFLEAVDPLPESEVPDLEDTGIPLPPARQEETFVTFSPLPEVITPEQLEEKQELDFEPVVAETDTVIVEMEESKLAEQLMKSVQSMVDPNAPIEKQLAQMRAQLAALAQLPGVIQQTLELVTDQLKQFTHQESHQEPANNHTQEESSEQIEESQSENNKNNQESEEKEPEVTETPEKVATDEVPETKPETIEVEPLSNPEASLSPEELEVMKREEEAMLEEQRKTEKQKKEFMQQAHFEHESRQIKQRPTPRVGKPKPMFGPLNPEDRPLVLPGGRRWRGPSDAYNEQLIAETIQAQSELIQGKVMGLSFESALLPYDERINFMKYEKPPVSLDHLQHSEVYKVVHDMDETPRKRVELLTPVIAEADYRKRCRSRTPNIPHNIPQQLQP